MLSTLCLFQRCNFSFRLSPILKSLLGAFVIKLHLYHLMSLYILSFFAGILTVLAPCVLPLLPVIIGGGIGGSKWRPYIITFSLAASLVLFTVLLKLTSLLININPDYIKYFSGIIIVFLGLISIFPAIWEKITLRLGLSQTSDSLLESANEKKGIFGDILTGFALGPVFSSCSPTYALALATVLQGKIIDGAINMFFYILGLVLVFLLISIFGRKLTKRLKFIVDPQGIFKKVLGVIFVIVGITIATGFDKKIELFVANNVFNITSVEQKLLNQTTAKTTTTQLINPSVAKQAPEITGITSWINSESINMQQLKGKVVLVDFWTYSCINCQRTFPYLKDWYSKYKDDQFVIMGLHAPEFAFEKKLENVQKAVTEFGLQYPIGLDNDFSTWNNFENNSWPAKYLVDKDGKIRYTHFGEGDYAETEKAIQDLIKENGITPKNSDITQAELVGLVGNNSQITPETYLGWSRSANFANKSEIEFNQTKKYTAKNDLTQNQWTVDGDWIINNENIVSSGDNSKLILNFGAKEVFIVAGDDQGQGELSLKLNGEILDQNSSGQNVNQSKVVINGDKLYKLIKLPQNTQNQTLEITTSKGTRLNVFTFG